MSAFAANPGESEDDARDRMEEIEEKFRDARARIIAGENLSEPELDSVEEMVTEKWW